MKKEKTEVRSQKSEEQQTRLNARRVHEYLRSLLSAVVLTAIVLSGSIAQLKAQQRPVDRATSSAGKQAAGETGAVDLQSVVAKQAALVTEFEVNGLKVLMKRREGSLTVAAGLFLRGGVRNITAENAGIESLMFAAATEATTNFPRERMRSELSRMGTVIGDGVNYDYSALTLAATRPNFDRSWEIFTDVALRPSFTKEDVTRTQSRLVASLRDDTDDPDTYLQRLQERVAYAGHPYVNRAEGTAESMARLTAADLQQYHQKMIQTSRLLLVIVGDLDPAQLKAKITASFGKLARGNYAPAPVPQLSFDKSTVEVTTLAIPTNFIQGLFTAPPLTSPDIYPMRVASSILRDRIFEEVRVKRNLSYAPDAFLRNQAANIGGIYVSADNANANQAVRVMLDEIARLQRESIEDDDIKSIVAQFLTGYYMSQETNAAQVGELAQAELIGGGWRNSVDLIDHLRAVTPADVQRVARKYMRNLRFVVLGNPKALDTTVFTGQVGQ
jgi:zinc protease